MALTRDDVVQTAIQLLDEVGLDGLTLRRLATELGISAPTLYWHVRDKRELLDLMGEVMVREAREKMGPFPTDLPWDEKIAEGMRRHYQSIVSYRDGARVVAGNRPTEAMLPGIERLLTLWVNAGFPPNEALAYVLTFGDFIIGSALEHQAEIERRRVQPDERTAEIWQHLEAYPILEEATRTRGHGQPDNRSSFERGLGLLMAGLRLRHTELAVEKQKAAPAARPSETSAAAD